MSTIYPGNYVCTLSGWAGQGVEAIPGGEFYRIVGYVKVTAADTGSSSRSFSLVVPSPDKREDDKVRADKTITVPAGSKIYRTSLRVYNLKAGANAGKLTVDGLTTTTLEANVAAGASADTWNETSEIPYEGHAASEVSAEADDINVTLTADKGVKLVDASKDGYVFVEVCYQRNGSVPNFEDFGLAKPE